MEKKQLPKLKDLYANPEVAFKEDEFNYLMYQQPREEWIKKHPLIKVKGENGQNTALRYIPVQQIEFLLSKIFGIWRREIIATQSMFNSIVVTVRLHVRIPNTDLWTFHDGVGACPIQTDSGAAASDMSAIKSAGVQMAAPAAASYALKDAAENLGRLFGKDLNKRDLPKYQMTSKDEQPKTSKETKGEDFPI